LGSCGFLLAGGIIAEDPLAGISEKPTSCNMDYVCAEGIRKLGDLRTVDMDDPIDVRDRMIAFALCFDLALRRSEAAWLDVPDLSLKNSGHGPVVHLHLPRDKQKGQDKKDCDIFSLFPQSARLVARYMQLRQCLRPRNDALLVSERGDRLLSMGVANAVRDQCGRLGILTKGGKRVSPHRLRHSLATLNAMPLGRLDESDLAKRLRHENSQTTRRIYIADNPEVAWQRHQEIMDRMKRQDDDAGGSARSIPCSSAEAATLSELQAIDILGDLGVTHAALRAAASADEALMGSADRPLYPRAYVEDIRDNWTTKREAKLMLGMTDHQLWHWLNLSGKKARLIGKVSLVRRSDVWDELRKRAARKTA
jgi:site-specific recombinase XerC